MTSSNSFTDSILEPKQTFQPIFRRANLSDAPKVYKLAKTLALMNLNSKEQRKNGFIVWVQDEEIYKYRISISKHFWVLEIEDNVVGYIMSYDQNEIDKLLSNMTYTDKPLQFVLEKKSPSLYLDQFALSPLSRKYNLSYYLHQNFIQASEGLDLYGCILNEPIKNLASTIFFNTMGWNKMFDVELNDKNWGWLKWGMYKYSKN